MPVVEPITTACGPRVLIPLVFGELIATHVSSASIAVSPDEVAGTLLWLFVVFWPALPPNVTSTVIVRPVVFANVSSQRVQLPGLETLIVRLIATPPSTIGASSRTSRRRRT